MGWNRTRTTWEKWRGVCGAREGRSASPSALEVASTCWFIRKKTSYLIQFYTALSRSEIPPRIFLTVIANFWSKIKLANPAAIECLVPPSNLFALVVDALEGDALAEFWHVYQDREQNAGALDWRST